MKIKYQDSTGRDVDDVLVDGEEGDLYVGSAVYLDDGEPVPDKELDWIAANYQDSLYEDWYQRQVGRAESWWEGDR
jgi:hypothetical protein